MPKVIDLDHLFETTVRLFAQHGYGATKTQEVARLAGVNEATLFRRFGNKAKLIEKALEHCFARTSFGHVEASGELREDLVSIVRAYKETNDAYGGALLTLLQELPAHPELGGVFAILQVNLAKVLQLIVAHQEKGALEPGEPFALLACLLAPLMLRRLWMRGVGEIGALDFDVDFLVDRFLDGHRKTTARL